MTLSLPSPITMTLSFLQYYLTVTPTHTLDTFTPRPQVVVWWWQGGGLVVVSPVPCPSTWYYSCSTCMPPVRLPCWELGPPGTATAWCGWCWGLWLCARLKIWYGGCGGNGGVQMHQNIRGVLLFMCKWILKQFIFNAANQLPELLQLWSVNIQLKQCWVWKVIRVGRLFC
ncbi:Hypothetical_protein [Hexamita inflata]|uniref:Hypothetical_protein n=1 Tax=Hexamita inflata TaxID=28002 RepID=A0AA86V301_9EUKA|nr:Hypothetical protein HINF_LOCUS66269 [Hexamita inflata]